MTSQRVADTWERGDPYEQYVGRWSRRVAPVFLAWLRPPPGLRWLDVGCGTGALSHAILETCAPASVAGVEPSDGFLARAREHLGARAALHRGIATELPLGEGSIDATVSGLVLNFVPDRAAALREMARVTAPGGTIAAYVWDYAGGMELMRVFWDAAVALDPGAAALDQAGRFPMCRPDALAELFASAGLRDVRVTAIDVATPFASFDDYWRPFLGGQGPAPAYTMALAESARERLRDRLRTRLTPAADGPFSLTARAWAVTSVVGGGAAGWPDLAIRPLASHEVARHRDVRLRALREAPAAFGETHADVAARPASYWEDLTRSVTAPGRHVMYVACVGDEIAGSVYGLRDGDRADTARVGGMWVDPSRRRRGAGAALLTSAAGWARTWGASRLALWAPAHGEAASALYRAHGFRETGQRRPFPTDAAREIVEMERLL
jgi:SAM-dependent methyltransferase/ribosomal protein S18 acetylase RimI-like enzyme